MDSKYKVGYYQKPFGATFVEVDLQRVFKNIRGTNFKKSIGHARMLYNEDRNEEYTLFKNSLPAVTFSGIFSPTRSAANLLSYSQLIVLDIDHIGPNLLLIKERLAKDKYVNAVWSSPSGDGLKFLISSAGEADDHKIFYRQAIKYFSEFLSIEIDKSGSDVSRLCFISYDPEIYINPTFDSFQGFPQGEVKETQIKDLEAKPTQIKLIAKSGRSQDEAAKIICKKIYYFLKKRNLSITSSYENWIRTAFAISNTFTADYGIRVFLDFCQLDGCNHNEYESEKLIISCYNKSSINSTFKTIIFLAQEHGYQLNFNLKPKK